LADLQAAKEAEAKRQLDALTSALVGMFNAMGRSFMQRNFEFMNPPVVGRTVKSFLERFDAIFTVNQDTLLEHHYMPTVMGARWSGCQIPGMKPLGGSHIQGLPHEQVAPRQPDTDNFRIAPNLQPYIKLHGSCNWNDGAAGNRILVMVGQKALSIDQFPVLTWYREQFKNWLSRSATRLMVVGYSFGDRHINDAIGEGVERGLKLFLIDPLGVDVLDKRDPRMTIRPRDEYMDKIAPHVIGASRRPFSSIFNGDVWSTQRS
jgi:SIR2-like domain